MINRFNTGNMLCHSWPVLLYMFEQFMLGIGRTRDQHTPRMTDASLRSFTYMGGAIER